MDSLYTVLEGVQVVPLRYHMNWPNASDPGYLYNPVELTGRRSFYGVNYVPQFRFEGKALQDPSDFGTEEQWYTYFQNTVDSLAAIPSPLRIEVDQWQTVDSIFASIDVIADDTISFNTDLYWIIGETWVRMFPNGKQYWTVRDFVPGATAGESISLALPGDSVHVEFAVAYNDSAYHRDRMLGSVFVQRTGTKKVQQAWTGVIPEIDTGVEGADAPLRIVLDRNVPNPFNPTTSIGYALDRDGKVRLSVYAPTGRWVTDLVDDHLGAGSYTATWDGRDGRGKDVGSGVYYYRLETEKTTLTEKMTLIR